MLKTEFAVRISTGRTSDVSPSRFVSQNRTTPRPLSTSGRKNFSQMDDSTVVRKYLSRA